MYLISHSSVAVGAVGPGCGRTGVRGRPVRRTLIDAVDRRRLVLLTTSLLALVSIAFTAQAFANLDQLWLLYLLTAATSRSQAINQPAQATFLVRLLPATRCRRQRPHHASRAPELHRGPSLAGCCRLPEGSTLLPRRCDQLLRRAVRRRSICPDAAAEFEAPAGVAAAFAGLALLRRDRLLGSTLADLNATLLATPIALFPPSTERFGGSPSTLGLLTAAIAVAGCSVRVCPDRSAGCITPAGGC